MDASSASIMCYRKSKPLGKVKRRVQDLRIPSSYYDDLTIRPALDLSHNESARLAVDCLISQGLDGYHEELNAEGEVDFLSELEKNYILENGTEGNTADPGTSDDDYDDDHYNELDILSGGSQSTTQCPAVSTDSEPTVAGFGQSNVKEVKWSDPVQDEPDVEVYFQSESRAAAMKDLVREFIQKAKMTLAIVMDIFTDVELLCDLLAASRKRNVSVHLLLDDLNLNLFITMWQDLKLNSKDFPKLSVRSVHGQTYCAKTGRKLTGQIAESFIITDWTEVLTGSFSFSWLSWQVHRSLVVLVKGSSVTPFHQEFHRLHSNSTPVDGFVTFVTLPLHITSHAAKNPNTGVGVSKSSQDKTVSHWVWGEDSQQTETKVKMDIFFDLQSPELDLSKDENHISSSQALLAGLTISTTTENNGKVHESNPLHTANHTYGQQRAFCYQSTLKNNLTLDFNSLGAERLFIPYRNRNRLTKPSGVDAGLNTQRVHWNYSLNFTPKVEHQSDNPKLLSMFTSQQKQATTGLQYPFTLSRGYTSGLQSRTDQRQPSHQSHPNTESPASKLTSATLGNQFKPQHKTDSELFSSGARVKLNLQQSSRLNWMIQGHNARPRALDLTCSTYGTGQKTGGQPGWRPPHITTKTPLTRSKSLTDRHTAGFNPNTTKT